jgi:hypothetical protein
MDITYSQRIGHVTMDARIMKLPDGRHAAEITATTDETGESVLWSRVFPTESIAVITGSLVRQWDYFVACRNGIGPDTRPED